MLTKQGSIRTTDGVRVEVEPCYLPEQSDPAAHRFIFGYRIRITNESAHAVILLSRRWVIVDADGERHIVEGDGVVGRQPRIEPLASFEYASYCPLATPWGTMEGVYMMRRVVEGADEVQHIEVDVGRFYLVAPREDELSAPAELR